MQPIEPIQNIGKIPLENFQIFPTYSNNVFDDSFPVEETQFGLNVTDGQSEQIGAVNSRPPMNRQDSVIQGPINAGHRGDTPPGFMRVRITQKVYIVTIDDTVDIAHFVSWNIPYEAYHIQYII